MVNNWEDFSTTILKKRLLKKLQQYRREDQIIIVGSAGLGPGFGIGRFEQISAMPFEMVGMEGVKSARWG